MRKSHQVQCSNCSTIFARDTRNFKKKAENSFCSKNCYCKWITTSFEKQCKQCFTSFLVQKSSVRQFCCQSCAATYNNKSKKTGCRRSKFELWVEQRLYFEFPEEHILFNYLLDGFELDVYFPNRKLAFEINGITHYKPIYGQSKFDRIKNNDNQKKLICEKKNIKLFIINISNLKRFSPEACLPIYENEISFKLKTSTLTGLEPTSNS